MISHQQLSATNSYRPPTVTVSYWQLLVCPEQSVTEALQSGAALSVPEDKARPSGYAALSVHEDKARQRGHAALSVLEDKARQSGAAYAFPRTRHDRAVQL